MCIRDRLETSSVRSRLEILIRELAKEREVLELRNKISEQVQEQVNQGQREFLLREQMKAIQKELGDGDDSQAEVDAVSYTHLAFIGIAGTLAGCSRSGVYFL